MPKMIRRVVQKSRSIRSSAFGRRMHRFVLNRPIVSITFDDFPINCATTGSEILEQFGFKATYYTSFGLMGTTAPTGKIFEEEDVRKVHEAGHELGCHTFDHCHAWETTTKEFARSVDENREALRRILPGESFESLSYPISCPRPGIKSVVSSKFLGCRAGGHGINDGLIDRNAIKSYFLERARGRLDPVQALIDQNRRRCGWLVLATHDISDAPTRFGCTPRFFRAVLESTISSGAEVLPVASALKKILKG